MFCTNRNTPVTLVLILNSRPCLFSSRRKFFLEEIESKNTAAHCELLTVQFLHNYNEHAKVRHCLAMWYFEVMHAKLFTLLTHDTSMSIPTPPM